MLSQKRPIHDQICFLSIWVTDTHNLRAAVHSIFYDTIVCKDLATTIIQFVTLSLIISSAVKKIIIVGLATQSLETGCYLLLATVSAFPGVISHSLNQYTQSLLEGIATCVVKLYTEATQSIA